MKLQVLKASVVASAIAVASGCASIVTDETTAVNVSTSNGQPAKITVEGQVYQAPGVIMMQKTGQDQVLVAEGNGCQHSTVVQKEVEPWFWGNIVFGGLLGSTTDNATNKMWTYQENVTISCTGS